MKTSIHALLALALLAACGDPIAPLRPSPYEPEPFACDPEAEPPAPESLQWKRVAALTADLSIALELPGDALCEELDVVSCRDVHRVALGGNDPYGAAQYEAVASPLATTPAAVDRLVYTACDNAAARDAAALDATEAPRVFAALPPTDDAVDAADPRLDAQIEALYRRLLARDATAEEIAILRELAVDAEGAPRTARQLDVLACFAIGTTSEMVLF